MNILLTSAGRRTYMVKYFKEALQNNGLVHASNSILTYTLLEADKYIITPNIYDRDYIRFLLDYCNKNDITVIISLFDIDLPILAKNKSVFSENGIKVIVSDYNVTQICNDKWETYNFLINIGLKQPNSFININDTIQALDDNIVSFPLIIKPRWGMGSIGIYKVCNKEELYVLYNKLYNEIFDTYLRFESNIDKENCIIIQEVIQGQEFGLEIFNDLNGNLVNIYAKEKIAMRAGETDIAETVDSSDFVRSASLISQNLKHIANLDVDCFKTKNDEIIILEMNCRFGGQYPFTHNSGVNAPKQILEWISGLPTNPALVSSEVGIKSCKELVCVKYNTPQILDNCKM